MCSLRWHSVETESTLNRELWSASNTFKPYGMFGSLKSSSCFGYNPELLFGVEMLVLVSEKWDCVQTCNSDVTLTAGWKEGFQSSFFFFSLFLAQWKKLNKVSKTPVGRWREIIGKLRREAFSFCFRSLVYDCGVFQQQKWQQQKSRHA